MADPVFQAISEGINEGAGSALSYYQQKNLMRQQQRYTKENMKLAQEMQQTDRQIAPLQSAEAMERAGLSSTLLTDGKFQLAGVTNHPGPAAPASTYHFKGVDLAALEQQKATTDAQNAQADLLRAQAEKTRVETGEIHEEQNAADTATRAYLEDASNDESLPQSVRNRAKLMLNAPKLGRSTLAGLNKFINFAHADRESVIDILENQIQVRIKQLQLENDVAQLRLDSEFSDYDKKELEVAKLLAEQAYIAGKTENLASEQSLNYAHVKELLAQAAKTKHTDLIALMDDPDNMEKLKNLGTKVFEGGLALAPYGLMMTAGKGVKGIKNLATGAKNLVKKFVGRKGVVATGPAAAAPLSRMPAPLKKTLDDKAFETEVLTRLPEKVRRKAYAEYMDLRRFRNYKGSFADFLKNRDKEIGNPNKRIHR